MIKMELLTEFYNILDEEYVISTLGETSEIWHSLGDRKKNFYMLGSMGMPISFGLGLALGTTDDVYVIDGDGSLLMNLGGLTTLAAKNLKNLRIIILDNGCYGSTGGQQTCIHDVAKLDEIASACGIKKVCVANDLSEFKYTINNISYQGTVLIVARIQYDKLYRNTIKTLPQNISKKIIESYS